MSVLFNHACRYELFDRNPIHLVRQSAKRRTPPAILVPAEIKALIDSLALRERTLVLLAASTGLRQSEIFGLKWVLGLDVCTTFSPLHQSVRENRMHWHGLLR